MRPLPITLVLLLAALAVAAGTWALHGGQAAHAARADLERERSAREALESRVASLEVQLLESRGEAEMLRAWLALAQERRPQEPAAAPPTASAAPRSEPERADAREVPDAIREARALRFREAFPGARWDQFLDMRALYTTERYAELAALAEDLIAEDPEWVMPYAQGGVAYAKLGDLENATRLLEALRDRAEDVNDPRVAPYVRAALFTLETISP